MTKFFVFILIVALGSDVGFAIGYEVKRTAGEYEGEVEIGRSPAVVGDKNIEIGVRDARGKPVTDAKLLYYFTFEQRR